MSGSIRNLAQTVQEREIIKQAPDVVVYIDDQDYLINPYLGPQGVAVPFNNFLTSFQGSYDIEGMIPSGSITLTVPNDMDYLFRSPGGNNLLRTMSSVRVFAKGYYLSATGNSMYYQVFRGYISNIGYQQDGKMTTISVQCFGSLGILEKMQMELHPAPQSSSPLEAVGMESSGWNLDPYDLMAFVFVYTSMIDGFDQASITQAVMDQNNPYYKAITGSYMARWQAYLLDLARDTHIFGCTPQSVNKVISAIKGMLIDKSPNGQHMATISQNQTYMGKVSESQVSDIKDSVYKDIRGYHPEAKIGTIQIFNGNIVSRLERLRSICNLINFELYQDLDGAIIVKPPLYNLDVTVVTDPSDTTGVDSNATLTALSVNNPFIVQLAEIITESESEDENAIRLTRIVARGDFTKDVNYVSNGGVGAVVEEIDVPKLAQFGLRTEPPRVYMQFGSDSKAFYSYAVAEMARANRGFHVINITIPLRPELKLGVPIYLPHKDVYGYIKSISISYSQGSNATMSIMLDSIRRRPMFPTKQVDANGHSIDMLNPQPNLVTSWTNVSPSVASFSSMASGLQNASSCADPTLALTSTAAPFTILAGTALTVPTPPNIVSDQDTQMQAYRRQTIGNSFGTVTDTPTACWNIQEDKAGVYALNGFTSSPLKEDWTKRKYVDADYLQKMLTTRPYTDAMGYELIGPFPWGRWLSLKQAMSDLLIKGTFDSVVNPVSAAPVVVADAAALLFTGDGQPAPLSVADTLSKALQGQASVVASSKVFELTWNNTGQGTDASGLLPSTVPNTAGSGLIGNATTAIQQSEARTQAFLSGQVPTSIAIQLILAANGPTAAPVSTPLADSLFPTTPSLAGVVVS